MNISKFNNFVTDDIEKQINEIIKLSGTKISESSLISNLDGIKARVYKNMIRDGSLKRTITEEDIFNFLESNEDYKNKLTEECETDDFGDLYYYMISNLDNGISKEIGYKIFSDWYDYEHSDLIKELNENNYIHRMITFKGTMDELLDEIRQNGTGNCWAKQEDTAQPYYGDNSSDSFLYIMTGEATSENVNWVETMQLRIEAPYENEIRLKPNSEIKIARIKKYSYNGFNPHMDEDLTDLSKLGTPFNVGSKYCF